MQDHFTRSVAFDLQQRFLHSFLLDVSDLRSAKGYQLLSFFPSRSCNSEFFSI